MIEILLVLVIVIALVLAARWRAAAERARELNASLGAAARDVDTLRGAISKLEGDVFRLAKWETVADADDAAVEMLRLAQAEADRLKNQALDVQRTADAEAATIRRNAEEEASAIRTEARTRATKLSTETEARLADAEGRATAIIEAAHRKAEEVAGDALKAVTDARALERTVDALKNTIEGYGDHYVIPTHTLLHDLAEGFSHTDADGAARGVGPDRGSNYLADDFRYADHSTRRVVRVHQPNGSTAGRRSLPMEKAEC